MVSLRPNPTQNFIETLSHNYGAKVNTLTFPNDPEIYKFNMNDFKMKHVIATSTRHTVTRYVFLPTGRDVVFKYFRIPVKRYGEDNRNANDNINRFCREIEIIQSLSSPYIVSFYGICTYNYDALICMEAMDVSLYELYRHLLERFTLFPVEIIGYIVISMVDALIFCNERGLMHRDIKPGNILLNRKGQIKIGDFGESRLTTGIFNIAL